MNREITSKKSDSWYVIKARTMLHVRSSDERHICEVSLSPKIKSPTERPAIEAQAWADARLIAAAPALYDALTELLRTETNLGGVSAVALLDAVDKARAALALVDGEATEEK